MIGVEAITVPFEKALETDKMRIAGALLTILLYLQIPEFHSSSVLEGENAGCAINSLVQDIFDRLPAEDNLIKALLKINRRLEEIETKDMYNVSATFSLISLMIKSTELAQLNDGKVADTALARLKSKVVQLGRYINEIYDELGYCIKMSIHPSVLRIRAKTITKSDNHHMKEFVFQVHQILVGPWTRTLEELASYLKEHPNTLCSYKRSDKQALYMMYLVATLPQLKGFLTINFSYKFLENGNNTADTAIYTRWLKDDFTSRFNETRYVLEKLIASADDTVNSCDAREFIAGGTYERVTHFAQGIIQQKHILGTTDIGSRCNGIIKDCQGLNFSWNGIKVCNSNNPYRRYDNVQSSNADFGKECNGSEQRLFWARFLGIFTWTNRVTYSFCTCYENDSVGRSDRYFSLKEAVSNTEENRIVTGVRFRKQDRVFHLQIQEGLLGAEGSVDSSTVQWKELPVIDVGTPDTLDDTGNCVRAFHALKYNERAIDLNEVKASTGHVLTGVRFVVNDGHLNLQAKMTRYDFVSGQLGSSVWMSSYDKTPVSELEEVILDNPDIPTEETGTSVINRKVNQFIKFTTTGRVADAAQTTIPYLDTQDVVTESYGPLSGVGLYHRASKGSGGFIGPRIYTYDSSVHCKIV